RLLTLGCTRRRGRPTAVKCRPGFEVGRGGVRMGTEHVRIFDTTLRDGEQAPGFSLRPDEKLRLARQLDLLGVDIIEAGFPIASPADAQAVRTIAGEIRRPVIACLARCHRADLE